jgi:AraC-like DNA-binding protein
LEKRCSDFEFPIEYIEKSRKSMSESNIDLRETHIIGARTRERIVSSHVCKALSLYGIHLTGLSSARPDFRFVRLQPTISQILVCLSGEGYVLVDGEWKSCNSGTAYITPPGVLHAYHAAGEVLWEICWVMYGPEEQARFLAASRYPLLIQVDPYPLSQSIEGLYRESISQADQPIMQLWAQLLHSYVQRLLTHQTSNELRLQRIWDAVNADIAFSWNTAILAEQAGMSTEHLRRLCQQYLGCSPMKYVTMLRMRHAAALLAHDAYGVEAVARRVGYENPYAFSTAFKRSMGMSPSLYRHRK